MGNTLKPFLDRDSVNANGVIASGSVLNRGRKTEITMVLYLFFYAHRVRRRVNYSRSRGVPYAIAQVQL